MQCFKAFGDNPQTGSLSLQCTKTCSAQRGKPSRFETCKPAPALESNSYTVLYKKKKHGKKYRLPQIWTPTKTITFERMNTSRHLRTKRLSTKILWMLTCFFALGLTAHSQGVERGILHTRTAVNPLDKDHFVYIEVFKNKAGSKFDVLVDFGESPEQIEAARTYGDSLETKQSMAAILNYMSGKGYELEQAFTAERADMALIYGRVFIFRKTME